jgi:hypothetical protein
MIKTSTMAKAHPATSGILRRMFNAIAVPITYKAYYQYTVLTWMEMTLTSAISVAIIAPSANAYST